MLIYVKFKLAKIDPNGNATTGITRTSTSKTSFSNVSQDMKFTSTGGQVMRMHALFDKEVALNTTEQIHFHLNWLMKMNLYLKFSPVMKFRKNIERKDSQSLISGNIGFN
jgi:hypothetical protein